MFWHARQLDRNSFVGEIGREIYWQRLGGDRTRRPDGGWGPRTHGAMPRDASCLYCKVKIEMAFLTNSFFFLPFFSVTAVSHGVKIIPSEEESSELEETAHGNGSSWKACLNLPLISLGEETTHFKKSTFRTSSNNFKERLCSTIAYLIAQWCCQLYSLTFKTSVNSHSTKSCAAVRSPRDYSDIIIYGFNSCWQPILFFDHNLRYQKRNQKYPWVKLYTT